MDDLTINTTYLILFLLSFLTSYVLKTSVTTVGVSGIYTFHNIYRAIMGYNPLLQ